jgi:hypothetical protein
MKSEFKKFCLFVLSAAVVPSSVHAAAIQISSGPVITCETGANCSSVDSLGNGQSVGPTHFSYNFTVGSDTYNFAGTYSSSYSHTNGGFIAINLTAMYTGSSPSATQDIVSFDLLQNYFDPLPGTWNSPPDYTETVPISLSPNVGPGSTVSANLCYNGNQCVGEVGPFGPGSYNVSKSTPLTGLGSGDFLDADFNFTFDFMPGTQPGAGAVTSAATVPEPAQTIPALLTLMMLGGVAYRRQPSKRTS